MMHLSFLITVMNETIILKNFFFFLYMKGKKGNQSYSNYDVVSLSNGVSSQTRARLFIPFLQDERSK